ncbi:gp53-like domain-containing protein [Jeongeupia chitinilytica]|uniref:Putative tail fiber protein gp53-like C-terminal domain-containing protein n=1 Tax=Jeongeupia chitinilytica TaxID=1041641 RepID=A0ABQ3GYG7_9NEIS|nr:hypothetical protein [Jeongeupia chitinilytica]GHD59847.1 hypothetical protein GCM10007350_11750 [Jeongeupia chitinilytica]
MGTLVENVSWATGVRYFEDGAVLTGGPNCPDNLPLQDLTNRTAWLKQQVETRQGDLAAHTGAADPHPQYMTAPEVETRIGALINGSPGALDTLAELAAALGNDSSFAATMTNALAGKAALAGASFTGPVQGSTPAQFDNSTKMATMAALRRELGSYAGIKPEAATRVMTASDVGLLHGVTAGGITLTLPDKAGLPDGASITFKATVANSYFTIASVDGITISSGNAPTSINVDVGEDATVTLFGAGWVLTGGTVLRRLPSFGASFASNGWQKLPSGLIIQWGNLLNGASNPTSATFPIAFPNSCLRVFPVGGQITISQQAYVVLNTTSLSGFTFSAFYSASGVAPGTPSAGGVSCSYFAIGM